jgi:hypothetical protein
MSNRAQAALRLVNESLIECPNPLYDPLSQAMSLLDAAGWLITPAEQAVLRDRISELEAAAAEDRIADEDPIAYALIEQAATDAVATEYSLGAEE